MIITKTMHKASQNMMYFEDDRYMKNFWGKVFWSLARKENPQIADELSHYTE